MISVEVPEEIRYLFTTKTCPNCKLAKEYLGSMNYIVMDAEENAELALKYKVRQAPTLVRVNKGQNHKYVGAQAIRKYVEETALVNA